MIFAVKYPYITLIISTILASCTPKAEPVSNDAEVPKPPGYLCVYYGYPSLINNAKGDLKVASTEFSKFDLIILGDGLQNTTHPDHANTKTIVANLTAQKRLTFGYVDLGVSTNNYSENTLRQQIDNWKQVGISGIMFDDAGFDYGVTRERQNVVIQHCRQQNLKVMMNAWNPDDVLGGNSLMGENDYYLAESFLVGNNNYFDLNAWKKKADACHNYMKTKGVKIVCLATGGENIAPNLNTSDSFSLAWTGTALYNFSYFQMTNFLYSANNNTVYFFPNLNESYGTVFEQADIQQESNSHYFRSTDTHTLHIYANGSTQGYGKISRK